jgi:hypothetical protein
MKTDTIAASLLWGRIGGAVLCLIGVGLNSFGVEFGPDEQQSVFNHIDTILITIGALMAAASKVREQLRKD